MRVLTVGLLVLGGLLFDPSLALAISSTGRTESTAWTVAAQQPISTVPPLPQGPPRFSTIPPLEATPTPIRPLTTPTTIPTRAPVISPAPTRAAPATAPQVVPQVPSRQAAPVAPAAVPSQAAPRAGGFPLEVALAVFTGSATALGGGLYWFRRSRKR